jgi:hypothetical protein
VQSAVINYGSYTFSSFFTFVRVFVVLFARVSHFNHVFTLWFHFFLFFSPSVIFLLKSVHLLVEYIKYRYLIPASLTLVKHITYKDVSIFSNLHTEWHTISIWITWQKIPNNVIPRKDEFSNHNKPIRVITKLPNSEQSYKGKVKTHNYINRQNQSTTGKLWKP